MNIEEKLADCCYRDRVILAKHYRKIQKQATQQQEAALALWHEKLNKAQERLKQKKSLVPKIDYPDLPIMSHKQEIISLIKANPVIIVAGETGSGKSTQLAKMCLEAGFGSKGMIGHTQPRRIAAQAIARRVADELKVKLGEQVGYKIRFKDRTQALTLVKVVTDGMMLSETQTDKLLLQYEVIIVDEAHERSLNIDILFGILKNLIRKRPELRVIITSATIQLEKFAEFFDGAPIIEVPGRQFPVEMCFPFEAKDEAIDNSSAKQDNQDSDIQSDIIAQIVETVKIAIRQGQGDILIFQSGEREIQETIEVLKGLKLNNTTILPLYARLSSAQQQLIFKPIVGRKIVVSTNVAETSITVPNIRFVIDTGYHKISRYNYKNKLHRLEIEPISWASHVQRKGRCGRVGPGIYYALFSKEDLERRPEFTDPEILRTSLATVILNLLDLKIKDVRHFHFIDAPNYKYIKDGLRLLHQLEALDEEEKLSPFGQVMARIPIEPRLSRMIIEANSLRCLEEILIIVSALSIADPRDTPFDKREQAREKHAPFVDEQSEFMTFLKLWNFVKHNKATLSHRAFAQLCHKNFLSFIRVCEWMDLYDELKRIVLRLHYKINDIAGSYAAIHQSILSGMLDHIGQKDEHKNYIGARELKFVLHPSTTIKKLPQWLVCAELFHSSQTFSKTIAAIEPHWLAEQGKHLIKKSYLDPHFDVKTQSVVAIEKSSLFGLAIESKKVFYEQKNPRLAKELFIREALLEEQLSESLDFYLHNKQIILQLEKIAQKTRYRYVFHNQESVFEHYKEKLPDAVASLQGLKAWLNKEHNQALKLSLSTFVSEDELTAIKEQYPDEWMLENIKIPISYEYNPGDVKDGATLCIPLEVFPFIANQDNSWLISGWLADKLSYDLRNILRQYKHKLPTSKQLIDSICQSLVYREGNYEEVLTNWLAKHYQILLAKDYFSKDRLQTPHYLRWHYSVLHHNKEIMSGDDPVSLFQTLKQQGLVKEVLTSPKEMQLYLEWSFPELPLSEYKTINHKKVLVYPALVQEQQKVAIQFFNTSELALQYHAMGIVRLITLALETDVKYLKKQLTDKNLLKRAQHYFLSHLLPGQPTLPGQPEQTVQDILIEAAIFECFVRAKEPLRSKVDFDNRLNTYKNKLATTFGSYSAILKQVIMMREVIEQKMNKYAQKNEYHASIVDIQTQLKNLHRDKCLWIAGLQWFARYPVYMKAIEYRLDKLPSNAKQDILITKETNFLQRCMQQVIDNKLSDVKDTPILPVSELTNKLNLVAWKIEELRISHFAQRLGTIASVSKQKIIKDLE